MISYIFRTPIEQAPENTLFFLMISLLMMGVMVFLLIQRKISPRLFAILNLIQQGLLYYWYIFKVPDVLFTQGLPIYHCRLAILTLSITVVLGQYQRKIQTYFAYLGLIGSVLALIVLDFDAYQFPHFTLFSYLIGHYLLFYLSLHVLLQNKQVLSIKYILVTTTIMNCMIQLFNILIEGANYGSLMFPPNILPLPRIQPMYFLIANLGLVVLLCISRYTHYILDGKANLESPKRKLFSRTPF